MQCWNQKQKKKKNKNEHARICGCKKKSNQYCSIRYQLMTKPYYRIRHKKTYIPKPLDVKYCAVCGKKIVNNKGGWKRVSCSPVCAKIRERKRQVGFARQKVINNPEWYEQKKIKMLENWNKRHKKKSAGYPFLDNNKWWIGEEKDEENEYWVLFVRYESKVWKSAMRKTELNMIESIGRLEGKVITAKEAIALTMVYHIESQIKKQADKEVRYKNI